jgi:hypothetical protein
MTARATHRQEPRAPHTRVATRRPTLENEETDGHHDA